MNSIKYIFLALCLFLSSSCAKETELSGEVFVVTKGAGNYKFGLVQVVVLPLEETKKVLKDNQEAVSKAWAAALEKTTECERYERKYPCYGRDYQEQQLITMCKDEVENAKDAVYTLYFSGLPKPISNAETNSDGKFSLKIPNKGKYAIAATAKRSVTDSRTEMYHWLVEFEADGSQKTLTLSNNNMVGSESPASLIKAGG